MKKEEEEGKEAVAGGDILREACKRSLSFLCQKVLGYTDWDVIHDDIERFLLCSGKRKLILVPRGHLKTSIITKAYSIQRLLENPNMRILIANQVWDKAREMLFEIKEHLERSELPNLFGNFVSSRWNADEISIMQRTKSFSSPSIGTTGVEAETTSSHFDGIILDDLQGLQNSQTKEQRDKVKRWYRQVFSLLEPEGWLMVVGTRWHQDDLYVDILENEAEFYDVMIRKVVENGKLIFPKKFSLRFDPVLKEWRKSADADCMDYVDHLRKTLRSDFHAQFMNDPVHEDSRSFSKERFQYWGQRPNGLYTGITVDPAISIKNESDFTAIVVAGMDSRRQLFVLDYVKGHWLPSEMIENIFQKWGQWTPLAVGLETQGFQRTLKYALEDEMRRRGKYFAITELNQTTRESKEFRIKALEPYYQANQVWHAAWMKGGDLEKELLDFPRAKHDDLSDALSMHLRILNEGSPDSAQGLNPLSWEAQARRARGLREGGRNFYDYW